MSQELPEEWSEPVHEALLKPASFFGAAPRHVMLIVYGVCALVLVWAAMAKLWLLMGVAVVAAAFAQVLTASLTYLEPHWFELLTDWLRSPQSRVDP
jgi:type IV secretory pathway TrbD component